MVAYYTGGPACLLAASADDDPGCLTCLTGTDPSVAPDREQISAVVTAIASTCACANFDGSPGKTHSNYLSCTKGVIAASVSMGQLRKQCKGTVTKYYKASSCGLPASQNAAPCIKKVVANAKVTCAIKPAAKCRGTPGEFEQNACLHVATCIDAADSNHDGIINSGDSGACPSFVPQWTLGNPQTLLPDGALGGMHFFPDEAIVRVPGVARERLLVVGLRDTIHSVCPAPTDPAPNWCNGATYLVEGTSLEQLQTAVRILSPGDAADFDNSYAGICGLYRPTDGRLYGFYHEEDHVGVASAPGSFYAKMALAVSDDDGLSWQKLGPVISGNKAKEFSVYPDQPNRGVAVPSVVADPTGRYLYAYYDLSYKVDQTGTWLGTVVGMARADVRAGPPVPGRWLKYFGGQFGEPGLGGQEDVVLSVRSWKAIVQGPHVTHSAHLRSYVIILGVSVLEELFLIVPLSQSGLYVAFSDDAVTWSEPQLLFVDYTDPVVGKSVSWEANVLWDDDSAKRGWLIYGHSDNWGSVPHYMVGRRIEFR